MQWQSAVLSAFECYDAVVEVIGDGVGEHADYGGNAVTAYYKSPWKCMFPRANSVCKAPCDGKLDCVAKPEANEEFGSFAFDRRIGMKYPCLVPKERVDHSGYISKRVGNPRVDSDDRFAQKDYNERG